MGGGDRVETSGFLMRLISPCLEVWNDRLKRRRWPFRTEMRNKIFTKDRESQNPLPMMTAEVQLLIIFKTETDNVLDMKGIKQ